MYDNITCVMQQFVDHSYISKSPSLQLHVHANGNALFYFLNYFSVPANIHHLISDNYMEIKQKSGVRLRIV